MDKKKLIIRIALVLVVCNLGLMAYVLLGAFSKKSKPEANAVTGTNHVPPGPPRTNL